MGRTTRLVLSLALGLAAGFGLDRALTPSTAVPCTLASCRTSPAIAAPVPGPADAAAPPPSNGPASSEDPGREIARIEARLRELRGRDSGNGGAQGKDAEPGPDLARDSTLVGRSESDLRHVPTLLTEMEKATADRSEARVCYLEQLLKGALFDDPAQIPEVLEALARSDVEPFLSRVMRILCLVCGDLQDSYPPRPEREAVSREMVRRAGEFILSRLAGDPLPARRGAAIAFLGNDWWRGGNPAGAAGARAVREAAKCDPDYDIRAQAVFSLDPGDDSEREENENLLITLARGDLSEPIRKIALTVLGTSAYRTLDTARVLVEVARSDPSPSVRDEASGLLRLANRSQSSVVLPFLYERLGDTGAGKEDRLKLMEAVAKIGGTDALSALRALVPDPDLGVDAADYVALLEQGVDDERELDLAVMRWKRGKREKSAFGR